MKCVFENWIHAVRNRARLLFSEEISGKVPFKGELINEKTKHEILDMSQIIIFLDVYWFAISFIDLASYLALACWYVKDIIFGGEQVSAKLDYKLLINTVMQFSEQIQTFTAVLSIGFVARLILHSVPIVAFCQRKCVLCPHL